jgi:hypothetical protein
MYMGSSLFWDVTQHRLTFTDVSRQLICPIFRDQTTPEDRINRLCRNVGNYQSTLRNISEARRSHGNNCSKIYTKHWNKLCMRKF